MKRLALALLACAPLALVSAAPAPAARTSADARFTALWKDFLDRTERMHPVFATGLGEHRLDAQLDDLSAAGRAADLALLRATQARLAAIPRATLTRDNQVDAALLANQLASAIWTQTVLKDWQWDPQGANETISGSLYLLAARDFAPWRERLVNATQRMEAIPAAYAQMRASIDAARVPAIYADTLSKQNGGTIEIAEGMLAPHKGELNAAERTRFDAALTALKTANTAQQTWIDKTLVPQAKGSFRLGAKLYDQKFAYSHLTDLTRPQLKAAALKAKADARAEMYAIARAVLKDRALPAMPTAAQQQSAIEAALELTYAHRPARAELANATGSAIRDATAFVRAKRLVGVPDAPVQVIDMPKFRQGSAVAYCDSPGPLERGLPTLVAVSPIPADWTDAQATSFLREYNNYMIQDLAIHEAMPGHYLQIAHANENPSTLRAILGSGSFVEGWAVYGEGVMKDGGYMHDPLFALTVLKMRLRSITNTLLDIGIQTEGMTKEQAMALMMHGAFQQEREASGKWVRAQLSSTQLVSYFLGYQEHLALRRAAEGRDGAKFDLEKYHDAVLSHGSPPARYVGQLMSGAAIR